MEVQPSTIQFTYSGWRYTYTMAAGIRSLFGALAGRKTSQRLASGAQGYCLSRGRGSNINFCYRSILRYLTINDPFWPLIHLVLITCKNNWAQPFGYAALILYRRNSTTERSKERSDSMTRLNWTEPSDFTVGIRNWSQDLWLTPSEQIQSDKLGTRSRLFFILTAHVNRTFSLLLTP